MSNRVYNAKDLKEDSDVEKDDEKDNKEEDSNSDDPDENDDNRPLVLFKNQVEEVIHSFSDV